MRPILNVFRTKARPFHRKSSSEFHRNRTLLDTEARHLGKQHDFDPENSRMRQLDGASFQEKSRRKRVYSPVSSFEEETEGPGRQRVGDKLEHTPDHHRPKSPDRHEAFLGKMDSLTSMFPERSHTPLEGKTLFGYRSKREIDSAPAAVELQKLMTSRWGGMGLRLEDVSMSNYLMCHVRNAPVELLMVDESIPETSSTMPPPSSLIWNPHAPEIASKLIHNPSSVALMLQELGYDGGFYNPCKARLLAARNSPHIYESKESISKWPSYHYTKLQPDENPYVAQLLIRSKDGIPFHSPIILTLPSPYVIPRFALLKRIFSDEPAKQLLRSNWTFLRSMGTLPFTPTALAIMTGDFLQNDAFLKESRRKYTLDLDTASEYLGAIESLESLWARFLSQWVDLSKFTTETITVREPNSPPPPHRLRERPHRRAELVSVALPEPECWRRQPLIIRDPYAVTQNHAEGISMSELARFAMNCSNALKSHNRRIIEFSQSHDPPIDISTSPPSFSLKKTEATLAGKDLVSQLRSSTGNSDLDLPPSNDKRKTEATLAGKDLVSQIYAFIENKSNSDLPPSNDNAPPSSPHQALDHPTTSSHWPHFTEEQPLAPLKAKFEASSTSPPDLAQEDTRYLEKLLERSSFMTREQKLALSKVQAVIKKRYGQSYSVEVFGSSRYGLSNSTSDVDMVILDPSMPIGTAPRKKPNSRSLYSVKAVARWISKGGFKVTETITQALVPIVKFEDSQTGQRCDICVNERLGLYNTKMLQAYCDASPLLRHMLLLIKPWAKIRGLNSPGRNTGKPSTFSSYAFTLMTVAFLQTRGLSPNLQGNLPPLADDDRKLGNVFYIKSKKKTKVKCDIRFHSKVDDGWRKQPDPPIREILRDWFSFWGNFSYADTTVSIRHGRLLNDGEQRPDPVTPPRYKTAGRCYVLDPFVVDKNVTGAVGRESLRRFTIECKAAALELTDGASLAELVENETRRQVLDDLCSQNVEEEESDLEEI